MKKLFLVLLLVIGSAAVAEERMEVCAEYTASGKKYKVDAVEMTGSELNSATNRLSYDYTSTYIVIFWSEHEASVINVGPYPAYMFGATGTDQEGRKWRISSSTMFCT